VVPAIPPPPPDLSAVAEPPSLVVSGRIAKLSASLAAAHAWTKLPMPQSEQITEVVTGENIGPIIDLDQPIDFAMSVTGSGDKMKDLTAVSAAVKDPDRVRVSLAERYKLVPGDNGALLIQGLGKAAPREDGADDGDDDDGKPSSADAETARTCEIAPAFGDAPVRLVCGFTPRALAELGPWLLRTAPRASSAADLHVDVRMKPLQAFIAEEKQEILGALAGGTGGSPMGAFAVAEGTDLANFADDLDGASVDVTLAESGAQAALTLRLAGTSSSFARIATAHPERSGSAPAALWQLPADADLAFFQRGIDEPELAKGRDLAMVAVAGALEEAGVKDADRKAVVEPLGKLLSPAASVYGSGIDVAAVRKALAREKALTVQSEPSEKDEAKRQAVEELIGWRLIELDEPSTRITTDLKEVAAALGRPSVAAAYREKLRDALAPTFRAQPPLPKGTALPAGAQHYVLALHPFERKAAPPPRLVPGRPPPRPRGPPPPLKPLLVHVFAVPDGQHTWLAIGGDEAIVASRVATALGRGGDTLASHPELAPLKDGVLGAGGFIAPRALPEAWQQLSFLFYGASSGAEETLDEAAQLPHQGLSPVLFSSTAQAGTTPAVTVSRISVPKEAIEDAVAAILRHGGF
jgi:hypothetical protein